MLAKLNPQPRWLTQLKSDSGPWRQKTEVAYVLAGKDKAAISASTKSRIAKLLQTKSASDFDGTISPPREKNI